LIEHDDVIKLLVRAEGPRT